MTRKIFYGHAFVIRRMNMASQKILAQKQLVIDEIKDCVSNAKTYVLFDYRGLTDTESKELRRKLKETGSDYKVYQKYFNGQSIQRLKR